MKFILNNANNDRKELLSKSIELYKDALSELENFSLRGVERDAINILKKAGYHTRDSEYYINYLDRAAFGSEYVRNYIKYKIIDAQKELSEELKRRAIEELRRELNKK